MDAIHTGKFLQGILQLTGRYTQQNGASKDSRYEMRQRNDRGRDNFQNGQRQQEYHLRYTGEMDDSFEEDREEDFDQEEQEASGDDDDLNALMDQSKNSRHSDSRFKSSPSTKDYEQHHRSSSNDNSRNRVKDPDRYNRAADKHRAINPPSHGQQVYRYVLPIQPFTSADARGKRQNSKTLGYPTPIQYHSGNKISSK